MSADKIEIKHDNSNLMQFVCDNRKRIAKDINVFYDVFTVDDLFKQNDTY